MRNDCSVANSTPKTASTAHRTVSVYSRVADGTSTQPGAAALGCPVVSLAPKLARIHPNVPSPQGRKKATHCKRKHPLVEGNLYIEPNGSRSCATCRKAYAAIRYSHGRPSDRTNQEGRDAPGSGQKARSADHPVRHPKGSPKGSPWRQTGQFRSHGQKTLQTPGG